MAQDVARRGGLFTGTSERGDFQEALTSAVAAAKAKANFVRWKLHAVSGERGGFAGANRVVVTIRVEGS